MSCGWPQDCLNGTVEVVWKSFGSKIAHYRGPTILVYLWKKQQGHWMILKVHSYWRNNTWNFQELVKNAVEFPGVIKKIKWDFQGSWFSYGTYKGFNTILQNFRRWSFVLSEISKGKVRNPEILDVFSKTSSIQSLVRREYRSFLRLVTAFGCTKIGTRILLDQLKI